jgi:hypothetical protein
MSIVQTAVRDYIRRGLRPVPVYGIVSGWCECGDHACKERDHGKHEPASTDGTWKDGDVSFGPGDFEHTNNVALAMGPQPDGRWLVTLDADGAFEWERLGILPRTLTQKTPRGEHRFFEVPPFTPLGNWVDVFQDKPDPSLDIRYARGRAVVAPSRNAFGEYSWLHYIEPAMLPEHVIDMILDTRRARGLPVQHEWSRERKRA